MFTKEIISRLQEQSVLIEQTADNKSVYSLNRPAKLIFEASITEVIKSNYKADEEIGGILWVKAERQEHQTETILNVEKVSFIRNAIEDKARTDNRSKKDTYLLDRKEFLDAYSACVNTGLLPIKFHTHPTDGASLMDEWQHTIRNWETSKADINESQLFEMAEDDCKLILPRVLIVGHGRITGEFFYGVYGGMVSPNEFKESKEVVQKEHLELFFNKAKTIQLKDKDKALLFVGLAILIFIVIRYRKTSIPILLSLWAVAPAFTTNTDLIESPKYFCKTRNGKIEIFIP